MKIKVTQDFIDQRNINGEVYNAFNRSKFVHLKAIECEILEHDLITKGILFEDERWEIDGIDENGTTIDFKNIVKYYNVTRRKLLNILKQQRIVDVFTFWEWVERPARLLEVDDIVTVNIVGDLTHQEVLDNLKTSFQTDGFYVDVRKILKQRKGVKDG